jgi:Mrp family chromosome partitioning ATPase
MGQGTNFMEIIKNISARGRMAERLDGTGLAELNAGYLNGSVNGIHPHDECPPWPDLSPVSPTFLYANRIIAFDSDSSMAHAYDVLRNQLLNEHKDQDTRVISVTAPTRGCGATVTAINLALSFARVPGSNVLLVDANSRDPAVGTILGLPPRPPFEDPIRGWLTTVDIRGLHCHLLRAAWGPGKIPLPADLARMTAQVEFTRQMLKPTIVLFDLPPMLSSDEVIPFVDMSDTAVIVLAVGKSRLPELEICRSYLGSEKSMQVVLNKTKRHGL